MIYGFNVRNKKMKLAGLPQEDSFAFNEQRKRVCVADLVTRDFKDGCVLSKNIKGLIKARLGMYPDYSYAADLCTRAFMETKSLAFANEKIGAYNFLKDLTETNYLGRDLAGCTAAGFWEDEGIINWSFICDSGIAIIGDNGKMKFKTPDEGPHSEGKNLYLESIVRENGGWNNLQARVAIRKNFRNNPELTFFSFGVLTGEEEALSYIQRGAVKSSPRDYVLAFTDGMADIAFGKGFGIPNVDKDFFFYLNQDEPEALKKFCQSKVHSEGTLVVYKA